MSAAGTFLHALQEECGGSIPFERFMQEALYHPEFGYYTSRIRTVGARGDFSTWPTLTRLPARAIAAWFSSLNCRHLIEIGAGSGTMARDILRSLPIFKRWRTRYHIVEISPVLRERQRQTLRRLSVTWHDDLRSALRACSGVAAMVTNELVDAFPCRVFVKEAPGWKELALRIEGNSAREVLREAALPDSSALDPSVPEGQRVEVHESYRAWLDSWREEWKGGRLLTIDYGGKMPGLYARRPAGSLRAYAHQQRLTGAAVFSGFGTRDITADVNFTDLIHWGEALGWSTRTDLTLGEWISSQRPREKIPPGYEDAAAAFRVLEQSPLAAC